MEISPLHSAVLLQCVNTLNDNSGFHYLCYVTQTLRCALRALCGWGVRRQASDFAQAQFTQDPPFYRHIFWRLQAV